MSDNLIYGIVAGLIVITLLVIIVRRSSRRPSSTVHYGGSSGGNGDGPRYQDYDTISADRPDL